MTIETWAPITAGDDAVEEPHRQRHARVIRKRLMHVKESVYDAAVHVPHDDRPHDHCGKCSPRLQSTAVPNLITDGLGVEGWTKVGATQSDSTGTSFSAGSQNVTRRILHGDSSPMDTLHIAASKFVFGAGCPLVVAVLVRKVGTVTAATLEFGLADATVFATGAKATVTIGDITTSFKRFYAYLPSFSASAHVTDCRFKVATGATFTGGGTLQATFMYLRPSAGLGYWQPGHMETAYRHGENIQDGPASLYDQARDFTDATELTPS